MCMHIDARRIFVQKRIKLKFGYGKEDAVMKNDINKKRTWGV